MLDAPKLTRWFGGTVRPAHVGVYERDVLARPWSKWNGHAWLRSCSTPEAAAAQKALSVFQSEPWRGLAAPSDAALADAWDHLLAVGEG